jgi:hypothetical protein
VAGEATVDYRLREHFAGRERQRRQREEGREETGGRGGDEEVFGGQDETEETQAMRMVTGGADWSVCIWEVAAPNPESGVEGIVKGFKTATAAAAGPKEAATSARQRLDATIVGRGGPFSERGHEPKLYPPERGGLFASVLDTARQQW